ncbi:hypothetical protein C8Q74DRAFT_1227490 [Fomes fomentarius]|nr:hypothetical protein C8Q74DRAFT_1227490 [Fomes fomentarius]
MAYSRGFNIVRTWILVIATVLSLVWTALLSAEIFVLYDRSDRAQRNLVGVMIFVNAVTATMPLVLLILEFRPYLDGARLAFLLTAHFGAALLFTLFNPTFMCPTESSQRTICRNVNLAITVCSWILPALLAFYAAFLAVMYHSKQTDPAPKLTSGPDCDPREKHMSDLPIMNPASRRPSTVPSMHSTISSPLRLVSHGPPPPLPPLPRGAMRPLILQPPPTLPPWRRPSMPPPPRAPQLPVQSTMYPSSQRSPYRSSRPPTSQARSTQPLPLTIPPASSSTSSSQVDMRRSSIQQSRPASQLPSPSTPQSSSRSTSRILSASAPLALAPIVEDGHSPSQSSGRSSGRLSKPAPLLY